MGIGLCSPGWSKRVLPPAAAEAVGRRGEEGRRGGEDRGGEGREKEKDGGGGRRASARRAEVAGLALGQSLRAKLQLQGQKNSLDPAPPASPALAWVTAAAWGKEPGEGVGEAGAVAEAVSEPAAALGPSCPGPAPLPGICAWPRPLTRALLTSP